MTGREKIQAAFSTNGSPEIPAVICYEGIAIRDHWNQLTSYPWWYQFAPDIESQMLWRRDAIASIGQDWFYLPTCHSREARQHLAIEVRGKEVFRRDRRSNQEQKLEQPQIAGWSSSGGLHSVKRGTLITTHEEIDAWISMPGDFDAARFDALGYHDLATQLLVEFGRELYPICHVSSPLWNCYSLWGFEGLMTRIAQHPDLVTYACERFLAQSCYAVHQAAALGAQGIWIEECMTDMISPQAFGNLNVPLVQRLVEVIRSTGMQSIYYFCGNPAGKWDLLLATGADALSLEESKKGFVIDIEEIIERTRGRCTVLGNLDAVGVLEKAEESVLGAEIARQIAAGRRNQSRFIMSIGSPVTPGTPMTRVHQYCDMVRHGCCENA